MMSNILEGKFQHDKIFVSMLYDNEPTPVTVTKLGAVEVE